MAGSIDPAYRVDGRAGGSGAPDQDRQLKGAKTLVEGRVRSVLGRQLLNALNGLQGRQSENGVAEVGMLARSDRACADPTLGPFDNMVHGAAATLARVYASRSETILKAHDVESVRECEQLAGWMGMSSQEFRRRAVEHAAISILGIEHQEGVRQQLEDILVAKP
jgi:hypothetical protein